MSEKTCPVSGNTCIECGLYRGRHLHCSFFRRNLEIDMAQEEIARRRREAEAGLAAEGAWDIRRPVKKPR